MKDQHQHQRRRSRMALVQLLLFVAVPRNHGLQMLSVRSPFPGRSASAQTSLRFSTALFSEATVSKQPHTETNPDRSTTSSTRKRQGKSTFLYKQKQHLNKNGESITKDTKTPTTSAEDLRKMAQKHSGKAAGSLQYKKAWTRWLYVAVCSIQKDLGDRLLRSDVEADPDAASDMDQAATSIDKEEQVRDAFETLFFDLGVAADEGTMPSFDNEAARKGYALEFFCRARSLAEFLLETPPASEERSGKGKLPLPLYPGFWTQSLRSSECPVLAASVSNGSTPSKLPRETFEIVSLGGRPGFDFVGVALAAAFSFHTTDSATATTCSSSDIHVTAMDYEEGWSDLVIAMNRSTRKLLMPSPIDDSSPSSPPSNLPAMSCDWGGKCDITKSILHEPVNAHCKRLLTGDSDATSAGLWICQYCVAENARALRESDYVFLKELVREMPEGTLVLLTEVVPRLWPEMVRMLDREGLLPLVDVGFRRGYNGKQFLLRKRGTSRPASATGIAASEEEDRNPFESLDATTRDQLEHFERLASFHEKKVDSGWKRQGRKDNGRAYNEEQLRLRRNRPEED